MRLSMWTYPWDVVDLGVDTVVRDVRDRARLNGVSLAAAYHAGRFLQPRSPRQYASSFKKRCGKDLPPPEIGFPVEFK